MVRYLKTAFWIAPIVPGLGRVPFNALACAGLAILGFGHPGFWLLGLAMEGAYLYAVISSRRFQQLVDAGEVTIQSGTLMEQRSALIDKLSIERRDRLQLLEGRCAQILQIHHELQSEEFVIESNREALGKLCWLYLKLLIAQQNLAAIDSRANEAELVGKIDAAIKSLGSEKISSSLRESKQATLRILEERLANLERRAESLEEMESDLARIEAQIDLAIENAGSRGSAGTISADIALASHLLDDSLYGDAGGSIAAIERTYAAALSGRR
ncbi:MAG: hypothetical protein JWL59_2144 [Chthoniobacteraceae bacterium]|nr:hypothetical protein [Chthoniobacteraceae bacterium]